MHAALPSSIQKLFWDADPYSLDQGEHQQLIIERVLNYGTLADWRWLVRSYGTQNIRATLDASAHGRSAMRSEARQLASLILR